MHYAAAVDGYLGRHRVKPGMTGWAQIHGYRGETDTLEKMQRRVQFDLYYIDHWSLLLDIKILLRTPLALLGKNAYSRRSARCAPRRGAGGRPATCRL